MFICLRWLLGCGESSILLPPDTQFFMLVCGGENWHQGCFSILKEQIFDNYYTLHPIIGLRLKWRSMLIFSWFLTQMNNIYITFDVCYAERRFRALLTSRMAGISQFWESLILVLDSQHIDEDQRFPETKIYQLLTMIYLNVTHFQNKSFKFKSCLESLIFQ